jgi:hypothetical protein
VLTGQRQPAVIPLVGHRAVSASAHFARSPSGRLRARRWASFVGPLRAK